MGRLTVLICSYLVVLALINEGAALKCYKCDQNHPDCDMPHKNNDLIQQCDSNHVACITERVITNNQTTSLVKNCYDKTTCTVTGSPGSGQDKYCLVCQEDLCNSSTNLIPTLLSNAILFVFVRYFLS
ncbi:hypothetical protein FQR65_LT01812 [Abscondita terminalis]|nr:hypothetical protein FQR65_LT01812 [Abscondita terminalis]